jgi:hypothetical protein
MKHALVDYFKAPSDMWLWHPLLFITVRAAPGI